MLGKLRFHGELVDELAHLAVVGERRATRSLHTEHEFLAGIRKHLDSRYVGLLSLRQLSVGWLHGGNSIRCFVGCRRSDLVSQHVESVEVLLLLALLVLVFLPILVLVPGDVLEFREEVVGVMMIVAADKVRVHELVAHARVAVLQQFVHVRRQNLPRTYGTHRIVAIEETRRRSVLLLDARWHTHLVLLRRVGRAYVLLARQAALARSDRRLTCLLMQVILTLHLEQAFRLVVSRSHLMTHIILRRCVSRADQLFYLFSALFFRKCGTR